MLFAFSLFFFHAVFSRSYMIPASDSLTPARYPTTELSSDTDCQSWYGHHRLRIQSHKTAHFRRVPQMGSQVTHTSARLATDLGVPTAFPAPFDNSLEQLKKHKITLYLCPPVYYRAYNLKQKRCTGQCAVCIPGLHNLFRNMPFTTLIRLPTGELLKPHLGDLMDVSLHSLRYIKSLVIVDWTQSPVPLELRGGAESSHPPITGLVPLAISSHPEAIWGPPRVTSLV